MRQHWDKKKEEKYEERKKEKKDKIGVTGSGVEC